MSKLVWVTALVALGAIALSMVMRTTSSESSGADAPDTGGGDWWPTNFPAAHRRQFITLVERYFDNRGEAVTIADGVATLPGGNQNGLMNIAQICAQLDPADWESAIRDHFEGMAQSKADENGLRLIERDWEKAKSLLTLRLWRTADLPDDLNMFVMRDDLDGVRTVLAFDLPRVSTIVKPEVADAWGVSRDEAFAQALLNLREKHGVEVAEQELEGGVTLYMLHAQHFYAASHVLLIDRHPECQGAEGTVVAIPNSQAVLCYPINSLEVVVAISSLMPIATGMWQEGPHSVVPDLYWYREGKFTQLPYRIENNDLIFQPPSEFIDALGRLPEKP